MLLAQDPQAQAVERGHGGLAVGTQRREPVLHLLSGAAGERDGQEGLGGPGAGGDLVGDPVGERAGLAAARPRDDQQRAVRGGRRLLVRVQPVQQRSGRRGGMKRAGEVGGRRESATPLRRGAAGGAWNPGPFGTLVFDAGQAEQGHLVQFVRLEQADRAVLAVVARVPDDLAAAQPGDGLAEQRPAHSAYVVDRDVAQDAQLGS